MQLKNVTGLDVAPDKYHGNNEEYITFNYADERGELFAEDDVLYDIASMQVHVFLKESANYLAMKKKVKDYLESIDAYGTSVTTIFEDDTRKRHMIFEFDYSKERD